MQEAIRDIGYQARRKIESTEEEIVREAGEQIKSLILGRLALVDSFPAEEIEIAGQKLHAIVLGTVGKNSMYVLKQDGIYDWTFGIHGMLYEEHATAEDYYGLGEQALKKLEERLANV